MTFSKFSIIVSTMFILFAAACGVQDPNGKSSPSGFMPECTRHSECGPGYYCSAQNMCVQDLDPIEVDAPDSIPVDAPDSIDVKVNTTTSESDPAPRSESTDYLPDPVRSPKACVLDFSSRYMSGATKGEVRGTLPLMTWEEGLVITDPVPDDDYGYAGITMRFDVPVGTYDVSYVGYQGSTAPSSDAWAQYGLAEDLSRMKPEALKFIQCNWYRNGEIHTVSAPECHIRIRVDSRCTITGAGNMAGFAG